MEDHTGKVSQKVHALLTFKKPYQRQKLSDTAGQRVSNEEGDSMIDWNVITEAPVGVRSHDGLNEAPRGATL